MEFESMKSEVNTSRQETEKTKKLEGSAREQFLANASKWAHYNFLEQNNLKDEKGNFVPRMRKVGDAEWINRQDLQEDIKKWRTEGKVQDTEKGVQIDIANIPFEKLPKNWQETNLSSVTVALNGLERGAGVEALGGMVHNQWKIDNSWRKTDAGSLEAIQKSIDEAKLREKYPEMNLKEYVAQKYWDDNDSYSLLTDEEKAKDQSFINKTKRLYEDALSA